MPTTRRGRQIFSYFDRDKQVEIIESVDRAAIGKLIADLPPDDRVDILKSVKPEIVDELLPFIPAFDRRDILRLRSYPEGTAGAMMTTSYAKIGEGLTVREALEEIGHQAEELETIYYVYIVDEHDHLRGPGFGPAAAFRDRQADDEDRRPDGARPGDGRRHRRPGESRPGSGSLRLARDSGGRRRAPHAGHHHARRRDRRGQRRSHGRRLSHGRRRRRWSKTTWPRASASIWWKRSIWLACLFLAEMLTLTVLAGFEHSIQKIVALAFFVPLCIATGGNSGRQAATLITRAMALGTVVPGRLVACDPA